MAHAITQIFHMSMFLTYVFTLYNVFQLNFPHPKVTTSTFNPGMLKFVTIWNVIVQALFFIICLLNDWFGTNVTSPKKPPVMRKVKDFLHATLGFPVAMFVTIIFWSLMTIDRELVFPKELDPYIPWWLNQLMHTMVMISTIIEMIMVPRQYPRRFTGVTTILFFDFIYLVWMHVVHYKSGIWAYPLLNIMSLPVRLVFLGSMLAFNAILYVMGETLNNFIWGNEYNKQQKSRAKSK